MVFSGVEQGPANFAGRVGAFIADFPISWWACRVVIPASGRGRWQYLMVPHLDADAPRNRCGAANLGISGPHPCRGRSRSRKPFRPALRGTIWKRALSISTTGSLIVIVTRFPGLIIRPSLLRAGCSRRCSPSDDGSWRAWVVFANGGRARRDGAERVIAKHTRGRRASIQAPNRLHRGEAPAAEDFSSKAYGNAAMERRMKSSGARDAAAFSRRDPGEPPKSACQADLPLRSGPGAKALGERRREYRCRLRRFSMQKNRRTERKSTNEN